ncbi:MAG TPA: alpha/beta hydrolase [Thermoanaerobaculia bacterium]|nr:alpha/beta hydrolase [Thermoanaerobaculia bacterium]
MKKTLRALALLFASGALLYLLASWLVGRRLARRLISAQGLVPAREKREELLEALRGSGAAVRELRHRGSSRDPVELSAVLAMPSGDRAGRPTVLFLHGKGGNSAEWRPEALRALDCGYNVLLPDLRGHGESGGDFVTYGFLEKDDLANTIAAAQALLGAGPLRLGVHGCSAGATLAIEFAAGRDDVAALWVESPYADPAEMAHHYLAVATRVPSRLLRRTSRVAIRTAVARVRRELDLEPSDTGFAAIDPLVSMGRIAAPVCLVYGEKDELVPPRFAAKLEAALPADSSIWLASNAGHCHHDDEAARVATDEYDRRWREFFSRYLPVQRLSKV